RLAGAAGDGAEPGPCAEWREAGRSPRLDITGPQVRQRHDREDSAALEPACRGDVQAGAEGGSMILAFLAWMLAWLLLWLGCLLNTMGDGLAYAAGWCSHRGHRLRQW